VSFEDFIQKSMKGLLGLGFKDFWAYYPTTLIELLGNKTSFGTRLSNSPVIYAASK
jgi:hypothetical protein